MRGADCSLRRESIESFNVKLGQFHGRNNANWTLREAFFILKTFCKKMKYFASGFVYIGGVCLRSNVGSGFMGLCKVGTCRRRLYKAYVFLKKSRPYCETLGKNGEYGGAF